MRKLVLVLVQVLAVASVVSFGALGCKHSGSAKLEGRWKGQKADGVAPESQVAANTFAQQMEIVAQGNQITITTPTAKNVSGTYFVDKEDATSLVIHTDRDGTAESFTFTDKAEHLVWKIDGQRTITFKKVP